MVPFLRPAVGDNLQKFAERALRLCFLDAQIDRADIDLALVASTSSDQEKACRIISGAGISGIPVLGVACANGSSALYLAREAVESGKAECVLVLGLSDWSIPDSQALELLLANDTANIRRSVAEVTSSIDNHEIGAETFARIAVKARQNAARNPYALLRQPRTIAQVLMAPIFLDPLTRPQCCIPTHGGAAVVLCSPGFARHHRLRVTVEIAAQSMVTSASRSPTSPFLETASSLYTSAGIGPDEIDVVEIEDTCTASELQAYESLGLVTRGNVTSFIYDGNNNYGGRVVTNPSGGLLCKGHAGAATSLSQCAELVWQLRGQAGLRQVDSARHALQHSCDSGIATVLTIYQLSSPR